ncbi:MAG TPA: hypothetical protein VH054_21470 [Polyangiaceae bacterium]|jgi:hypothetical protein|nr:hypothetical protein [Polyangiaceae bacterium]
MPAVVEDHGARVAARYGVARSSKWPAVEHAHLLKQPKCVGCVQDGARVDVHHVIPFHYCVRLGRPDLELDERNLLTLCANVHHLLIGHFDDYESMNLHAKREAERLFHAMTAAQIRANAEWRRLAGKRPPHLGAMSEEAQRGFQEMMDDLMPTRPSPPEMRSGS